MLNQGKGDLYILMIKTLTCAFKNVQHERSLILINFPINAFAFLSILYIEICVAVSLQVENCLQV